MKIKHLLNVLVIIPLFGYAQLSSDQKAKIETIQQVLQNAKHDTTIVNALMDLDNIIYIIDPEQDLILNQKIDSICNLNLLKNLTLKEKEKYNKSKGFALNNLGLLYMNHGNYAKAIENYTLSLKLREKLGDKIGIAATLNNIGIIYQSQSDYTKAIEYFNKSLQIQEEIGDKKGIAACYNNIGNIHSDIGNSSEVLKYYNESLKIQEEIDDKKGISLSLSNIGTIHFELGDFKKSLDFHNKSLEIRQQMDDKMGMSSSFFSIGYIFLKKGNLKKAMEYNQLSLNLAKEIGATKRESESAKVLWEIYKKMDQHKESLEMYELYISTRDNLESQENQKEIIRQEFKYNYEKTAADSVKNAEAQKVKDALLAAQKAENKQHLIEAKQQEQQKYYLFGGLALALLFGAFIFNRFRVTTKQKGVIEEQKEKVDEAFEQLEEKNKEIMDSINYAKRIQSAILPPSNLVKEYLQKSFILYKPKDIVAGDFYWLELKDSKVLFAAADCTGHGVPGAMVSVVCNNGLNRSVREHGLTNPGKILDKTREIVIQEFEKSEDEVKDGMDIALCSLEGNKLEYAGANNPLWIIRNGEVVETKADKQPIGKYAKNKPFTTHTFELLKGDSVYLFTDGFVDQFGGEKGKKFKATAFGELLLSIQDATMEEQWKLIDEAFETWRGTLEQIDDVCVIGIKI